MKLRPASRRGDIASVRPDHLDVDDPAHQVVAEGHRKDAVDEARVPERRVVKGHTFGERYCRYSPICIYTGVSKVI